MQSEPSREAVERRSENYPELKLYAILEGKIGSLACETLEQGSDILFYTWQDYLSCNLEDQILETARREKGIGQMVMGAND